VVRTAARVREEKQRKRMGEECALFTRPNERPRSSKEKIQRLLTCI
jgi:hypothetical protein